MFFYMCDTSGISVLLLELKILFYMSSQKYHNVYILEYYEQNLVFLGQCASAALYARAVEWDHKMQTSFSLAC